VSDPSSGFIRRWYAVVLALIGAAASDAALIAALFGPAVYSYLTWKREQG
jgi:hypothetical protein